MCVVCVCGGGGGYVCVCVCVLRGNLVSLCINGVAVIHQGVRGPTTGLMELIVAPPGFVIYLSVPR